ncbi:MAG: V-type ATP synthase subunit D [Burkholderiales bacterium]
MSEHTPTRSVVLELRDEQRAMRQGHEFLDEKCLLLAGEIVRELAQYGQLERAVVEACDAATRALAAAIARHGLEGLQVYPPGDPGSATATRRQRSLMGVRLVESSLACNPSVAEAAVEPSPEAERLRIACGRVVECSAALAAVGGNLERLSLEYQRSLRRARAIADVILPEMERVTRDLETRIEELEQEDATFMSRAAQRGRA